MKWPVGVTVVCLCLWPCRLVTCSGWTRLSPPGQDWAVEDGSHTHFWYQCLIDTTMLNSYIRTNRVWRPESEPHQHDLSHHQSHSSFTFFIVSFFTLIRTTWPRPAQNATNADEQTRIQGAETTALDEEEEEERKHNEITIFTQKVYPEPLQLFVFGNRSTRKNLRRHVENIKPPRRKAPHRMQELLVERQEHQTLSPLCVRLVWSIR